jgi:hypothetical protein
MHEYVSKSNFNKNNQLPGQSVLTDLFKNATSFMELKISSLFYHQLAKLISNHYDLSPYDPFQNHPPTCLIS